MSRVILAVLMGMIVFPLCFAQQQTYGYRITGNGNILSDMFVIQNGFVLDSVIDGYNMTFSFEYDGQGRLERDVNFIRSMVIIMVDGRPRAINIPGTRDYYYDANGKIDSVGYGRWIDSIWVNDSSGHTIHYSDDGKILSVNYFIKDAVPIIIIEENIYDSNGNLILTRRAGQGDTITTIREYDSQNRLTLRKIIRSGSSNYIYEYVYQYDATGNPNCAWTSYAGSDTIHYWKCIFTVDESGKATNEMFLRQFSGASIWNDTLGIAFNYDDTGRILQMGDVVRFYYNTDGNLDSLANLHAASAGYLGATATLIDSYGNILKIPDCTRTVRFYYSEKIVGVGTTEVGIKTFALSQNYPNPFNPKTVISYQLSVASRISLKVYDLLGREVATLFDGVSPAGNFSQQWNAANMASGVYFYRLSAVPVAKGRNDQAGSFTETKKLLLLR